MNTIPRFVLDDKCNVIDVLNLDAPKGYSHPEDPKTQIHLRERILGVRLGDLVDNLIEHLPEEKFCPSRPERFSIWWSLLVLIRASPLHKLDPAVSLDKRFAGELNQKREGLQAFTSLSLFTNDTERLLRDLYGDTSEVNLVADAVYVLVREILRYAHADLWQEHRDAQNWDYIWGVGLPERCGISGSDHGRAIQGADNLRSRARKVIETPSSFGKYTVEFATKHIVNSIRMEKFKGDELFWEMF
jgi:hypothetical protein